MAAARALTRTGFKFMLTVRDGPDTGATYQLLPPKVTIGRGPDNNVSLNDPRVSRSAAVIDFSMEQIIVTDISNRQSMWVNDVPTAESAIKDGDRILIGQTELLFLVEALPLFPQPPAMMSKTSGSARAFPPTPSMPFANVPGADGAQARAKRQELELARKKKIRFYIVVGGVLGAFLLLMTEKGTKPPKDPGIKTVEQIEQETKDSNKRQEQVEKKREFKTDEEKTAYEEAQKHFLQGFRDYENGQWARAMRSFETALAIDTKNELANRYYRLAEKHRDELINELTIDGNAYREKEMWERCSADFDKVLDALPNKQDAKYRNAEAKKKECDLMAEDRFK